MKHDLEYIEEVERELEKYDRMFLTTREVARLLGVSERAIMQYCKDGLIFAIKLGKGKGRWVIFKESLIELLLRRNNYEMF